MSPAAYALADQVLVVVQALGYLGIVGGLALLALVGPR